MRGVSYSPALKWSVLILLPLTIAWKLAIKREHPIEIQDAIVEFLANQQFDVTVIGETTNDMMPIIEANSDSCRLRVARVSPVRDEVNFVRRLGGPTDHIFFVFRRAVYPQQPFLTAVSYFWFRFLLKLGLVSRIPPVIAVVSSCNAEQLPWSVLRAQDPI